MTKIGFIQLQSSLQQDDCNMAVKMEKQLVFTWDQVQTSTSTSTILEPVPRKSKDQ